MCRPFHFTAGLAVARRLRASIFPVTAVLTWRLPNHHDRPSASIGIVAPHDLSEAGGVNNQIRGQARALRRLGTMWPAWTGLFCAGQ
jgi:hypothetical protein